MEKKNDVELIKELFEIVLLIGLIIIRFLPIGDSSFMIKVAGYVGVLVSVFDLYVDSNGKFSCHDKFHVIKGCSYLIFIFMAIFLLFFLTKIVKINDIWSDVFTLMALLITLPKRLYIQLLAKYICGGKTNEQ
jgi:hypothetical protein